MSEHAYFEEYPDRDKETIKKIIRTLLAETNIVRDKDDTSRMYYLFARRSGNIDAINEYLSCMDFKAVVDESGFIHLADAEANPKIRAGHVNISKDASKVLLALSWKYQEMERLQPRRNQTITMRELSDTMEKFHFTGVIDSIKKAETIFKQLARFNLLSVIGDLGEKNCRICIFPPIRLSLSPSEMKEYRAKYNKEDRVKYHDAESTPDDATGDETPDGGEEVMYPEVQEEFDGESIDTEEGLDDE